MFGTKKKPSKCVVLILIRLLSRVEKYRNPLVAEGGYSKTLCIITFVINGYRIVLILVWRLRGGPPPPPNFLTLIPHAHLKVHGFDILQLLPAFWYIKCCITRYPLQIYGGGAHPITPPPALINILFVICTSVDMLGGCIDDKCHWITLLMYT